MRTLWNYHCNIKEFVANRASKQIVDHLKNKSFKHRNYYNFPQDIDDIFTDIYKQITLISGSDSGQSDGLHSANLAEEVFISTKDNILARSLHKTTRNVREIHLQNGRHIGIKEMAREYLYFNWLKTTLPTMQRRLYYVFY